MRGPGWRPAPPAPRGIPRGFNWGGLLWRYAPALGLFLHGNPGTQTWEPALEPWMWFELEAERLHFDFEPPTLPQLSPGYSVQPTPLGPVLATPYIDDLPGLDATPHYQPQVGIGRDTQGWIRITKEWQNVQETFRKVTAYSQAAVPLFTQPSVPVNPGQNPGTLPIPQAPAAPLLHQYRVFVYDPIGKIWRWETDYTAYTRAQAAYQTAYIRWLVEYDRYRQAETEYQAWLNLVNQYQQDQERYEQERIEYERLRDEALEVQLTVRRANNALEFALDFNAAALATHRARTSGRLGLDTQMRRSGPQHDTKARSPYRAMLHVVNQTWGRGEEFLQAADAFMWNVYVLEEYDGMTVRNYVYRGQAFYEASYWDAMSGVASGIADLDVDGFLGSLAYQQATDRMIGRLSSGAHRETFSTSRPVGLQAGPAL